MNLPKPPGPTAPKARTRSVRPSLRMQKIHLQGRSAFPTQKAAFGPTDPLMGQPAGPAPLGPPLPGTALPGEDQS